MQEKLSKQTKNQDIYFFAKTIDAKLVSATRTMLAINNEKLKKEKYQESHSHAVDAMVLFYLANSKIKGRVGNQDVNTIEPIYEFDKIFIDNSTILEIKKKLSKIELVWVKKSILLHQQKCYLEKIWLL